MLNIYENKTPLIIAEVGMNHGGDEKLAWEMIVAAHENGAYFIKLQSFKTEEFLHPSLSYFADTQSMELSFEAQRRLFDKARSSNIKLMSTCYDIDLLNFVEQFDPPAYKIASMDSDNISLLQATAEMERPVFVSCGFADLRDIHNIVSVFEKARNHNLVLMHCVPDYPARYEDLNLDTIGFLETVFGYPVGFSDHSVGLTASFVALSLGAVAIEKHFTTDRSLADKYPHADHNISILPSELKELREFANVVSVIMGESPRKFSLDECDGVLNSRRGLYARKGIDEGEELSLDNVKFLRPVLGIRAGEWDRVRGRETQIFIPQGKPILFSDLGL